MTTDSDFFILGFAVGKIATVYCRWVNAGAFSKKAWENVELASMDVKARREGFSVFVDNMQGTNQQNRMLYAAGDTIYFRTGYDASINANAWHASSVSFPIY